MSKCSICGKEQKQIGSFNMIFKNESNEEKVWEGISMYNTQLLTMIKGKHICDECMDIYHKIYALYQDVDFSCGGKEYFADGRNLD